MSANGEITQAINIFFCYAREDEPLRNELEKHLRILKRQGHIMLWHDREISAGTEWEREITTRLNTAQIILLLISPDFMDSDYCYGIEMEQAIKRHNSGEACVLPIILRPVHWEDAPFSKLQVLPTDGKPVTRWVDLDEAFLDITRKIRTTVKEQLELIGTRTVRETVEQWITKGIAWYKLNNFAEALIAFEQAYILDPQNAETVCKKGYALLKLKYFDEALQAFEQALVFAPANAFYHYSKGIALSCLIRYQDALAAFEQATQLRSDYREAQESKNLMLSYIRLNTSPRPKEKSNTTNTPNKKRKELDNFTKQAWRVLSFAQEEALLFRHSYIGTNHLLLGLIKQENLATKVLANLGIDSSTIRITTEAIIDLEDHTVLDDIDLTPRAQKVIELAFDEAYRLNHDYVGTEHLLLGLLREGKGVASGVLESFGINLEKARAQTLLVLRQ